MKALEKLVNILTEYGMKDDEIDDLLGQFLQEEAEDYVKTMKNVLKDIGKDNNLN